MVRTRADAGGSSSAGRKVVAARAPRKVLGASSSSSASDSPSGKAAKYAGGNPACPRPTPEWQKGIGTFFQSPSKGKENAEPEMVSDSSSSEAGCSSSQSSSSEPGPSCSSNDDCS